MVSEASREEGAKVYEKSHTNTKRQRTFPLPFFIRCFALQDISYRNISMGAALNELNTSEKRRADYLDPPSSDIYPSVHP
jgi:hypothetical protein